MNKHEKIISQLLKAIGENPKREGLLETPKRVVKSWDELFAGYKMKATDVLKVFQEGACNEMVILKDIEFYSCCEHHMLPFFGSIHIGYVPNGKVIGVSKLSRLVEVYSRRLQIQERLVTQIADDIMSLLEAKGCIVVCEAQHFCMTSRGVKKQRAKMITSALRGIFTDAVVRAEFMSHIK